ncbi:hypothetical protein BASA81_002298 [Batrachochytrium salamandrivorans]|nr:hypothetical protein BASA81_002298 [Batrachochytrium salamandrivorans]
MADSEEGEIEGKLDQQQLADEEGKEEGKEEGRDEIVNFRKRPVSPPSHHQNDNNDHNDDDDRLQTASISDRFQPRPRMANERLLKVLLSGHEAGVLIGRGGSSVNELQQKTGTRVKVSNSTMLFPGTNLRIILIEGGVEGVEDVIRALVGICLGEYNKRENLAENENSEITFLLALPSAAAPAVIGKRGATVLELNKQTGCQIRLGRMEDEVPGIRERVARFTGKPDCVVAGVLATMDLIYKDTVGRAWLYDNKSTIYEVGGSYARPPSSYRDAEYRPAQEREYVPRDPRQYSSRPLTRLDPVMGDDRYRGSSSLFDDRSSRRPPPPPPPPHHHSSSFDRPSSQFDDDYRGSSRRGDDSSYSSSSSSRRDDHHHHHSTSFPPPPPPPLGGADHKLQVSVPDEFVGQMLGRAGENISIIQRQTRTRISVSPRTEFVPGTRDRIVTICGSSHAACREAEALLGDKLPKI